MKITSIGNNKIAVETPYNKEFVAKIKNAGGKWNPRNRTWELDERSIDAVRQIMRDVFGQDDLPQELVTVRIHVGDDDISAHTESVVIFGKTIATAWGRDSGAKAGDGVVFEKGTCRSGGSMKNWYTIIEKGSIITIYDVPKRAVEERLGWDDKYGTFEVVDSEADRIKRLQEEKKALLARLAEIEAELAELSK